MNRSKTDKALLFYEAWRLYSGCSIMPVAEYEFAQNVEYRDAHGKIRRRKYRFDYVFVNERVAVEVDGGQFAYGGGRHATDTDREKQNCAAMLSYSVFHFSPKMLTNDPLHCVEQVRMAILGV